MELKETTEEKAPEKERPAARETPPPPSPKPAPKREIRAIVLGILEYLVIGGGLLATGFLSAFITFTMAVRGNEVSVPNLVGTSLADASAMLLQAELNLRHEGNRFDESVPPDLVAGQNPPAGTLLKKGRSVRVWTSLGPERRTVPRIEGESLQSAQMILEQEGFTLGRVVEVHSEAYAPDSIIAQNPAPHEEAGEAIEVDVLISRGYLAEAYVMPDFIGQPISDVYDLVRQGGHRISAVRYEEYYGVPHGTVVRQTPRAGTKVRKRDRIVLIVSKSY